MDALRFYAWVVSKTTQNWVQVQNTGASKNHGGEVTLWGPSTQIWRRQGKSIQQDPQVVGSTPGWCVGSMSWHTQWCWFVELWSESCVLWWLLLMESDSSSRGCQPSCFWSYTSFVGGLGDAVLAVRTSQVGRPWW